MTTLEGPDECYLISGEWARGQKENAGPPFERMV